MKWVLVYIVLTFSFVLFDYFKYFMKPVYTRNDKF